MRATLEKIGLTKIFHVLLVFVPAALLIDLTGGDPVLVFIFAGLALIPLADLIGAATEELAAHTGPRLGGLLNATLGNTAELIITIFAINEGLLELVKASITGSIIGNLLLVLGLSLLLGGLKNGVQKFGRQQASLNATLLILAVTALTVPSIFSGAIEHELPAGEALDAERLLSEGVAIVMIVIYGLSVLYAFRTKQEDPMLREAVVHETRWSVRQALIVLALATLGTVFMSETLVGAVEHVTAQLGLTEFFIGIIIIPFIGNVAEHLVAVQVALKDDMELSLAISLGSSLQIALFVAPALVFIGLLFGQTLLLIFNTFELVALIAASLIAALIALDGESNWLEGAQLLAVYFIIAIAFFFLPG
ncbi:MAG: calcium/proton exchanger [Anaerolineae bacterium]|nr:calcium/proton exchanger [Anaerolineae bacterium]